jgi:hypothetical protein
MLALRSITISYEPQEDRVLTIVNPGRSDTWSCWLTRRAVLALLERAPKFLADTSPLAQRGPGEYRGELVAFERDAALTTTAKAMTATPSEVLKTGVTAAELAGRLTISAQGEGFRFELQGYRSGGATGVMTRAEVQRIIRMLEIAVEKAGWVSPAPPTAQAPSPKPVTH